MPDKERDVVAEANNSFSLALYPYLKQSEKNLFFSPFSIFTALSMVYAGAKNLTEKQMAETMHYNTEQEDLHPLIQQLTEQLIDTRDVDINIANALWVQLGYKLLNKYMFVINRSYNGQVYELDFQKSSEACSKINSWVSEQTREKIPNIINENMLQQDPKLILINAIYFKCKWASVFSRKSTKKGDFTLISGEKISALFMYQKNNYDYLEEEHFRVIKMVYKAPRFKLLVFLPKKFDGISKLEENLSKIRIEEIYPRLVDQKIRLFLPRFKFETSYELQDHMKNLGMADAFTNAADFSGITDHPDGLKLDSIVHKTFVEVNESGTEAAAATMVRMLAGSAFPPPEEPIEFRVDRPFIFMIYDALTKNILFMGRVMDPTKK